VITSAAFLNKLDTQADDSTMFVERTAELSLSSSEAPAGVFSRLLQNAQEDTGYNPFGKYFLWYLMLVIFCMIPILCSYCGRRRRIRHAFLHRMATNGVEVLGSDEPDEEGDELRRVEKMKRIEAVTQETTTVSCFQQGSKDKGDPSVDCDTAASHSV
jgi:hypothetical protein